MNVWLCIFLTIVAMVPGGVCLDQQSLQEKLVQATRQWAMFRSIAGREAKKDARQTPGQGIDPLVHQQTVIKRDCWEEFQATINSLKGTPLCYGTVVASEIKLTATRFNRIYNSRLNQNGNLNNGKGFSVQSAFKTASPKCSDTDVQRFAKSQAITEFENKDMTKLVIQHYEFVGPKLQSGMNGALLPAESSEEQYVFIMMALAS